MQPSALRRRLSLGLAATTLAGVWPRGASADDYPSRPVRMIVPFGPGSGSDILARMMADELMREIGGTFFIDNRPGASGIVAAQAVARSEPDGYTLLVTSNTTHSGNPALFKSLPYNPIADFVPVARLLQWTAVLVVGSQVPAVSLGTFVDWARAHTGKVSYAYSNAGGQLVAAALVRAAALKDVAAVPYKSSPAAFTDLMSGQVGFMVVDTASAMAPLKSGNMRPIGLLADVRNSALPNVPTFKESGFGSLNAPMFWGGVLAPAGTPRPIVERLNAAFDRIVARPAVSERMRGLGAEPWTGSVDEFDRFLREQLVVWKEQVAAAGIAPQ